MKKFLRVLALAAFAGAFFAAIPASFAQGSGSLEADLHQQFKATRMALGPAGPVIAEQGTILVVKKGGIRAYAPTTMLQPANKVQDGNVESAKDNPFFGPSVFLPVDSRVYVMRVAADMKKDRVTLFVMQCDQCNGAPGPSSFKAQVVFQFPQGWLTGADVSQVSDVVSQILAVDNGGGDNGQAPPPPGNGGAAPTAQQDAPQQAAPPQQTQTIKKGQSEDEVIAAFGQPDKVVDLGAKKLYVYKDMKITFIGGKVVDVQ
jgi:hypothetical protein